MSAETLGENLLPEVNEEGFDEVNLPTLFYIFLRKRFSFSQQSYKASEAESA